MEKMIEEIVDRLIEEKPEFSDMEEYRDEIVALALTKSEPLYSTTDLGHAMIETKKVNSGFRSKVTSIVLEAMEKVKNNPRN